MKYLEINKKTKDELNDMLKDLKKESYNLRFQKKNGQLEKTGRIKVIILPQSQIMFQMN